MTCRSTQELDDAYYQGDTVSFFLSLLLQMQDGLGVDCYGEYYPEIDRRGLKAPPFIICPDVAGYDLPYFLRRFSIISSAISSIPYLKFQPQSRRAYDSSI